MLNNDAFRAFVNKPLIDEKAKFTKATVREAVEVELSQKKHRKKKFKGNNEDNEEQLTARKKGKQSWQDRSNSHVELNKSIRYRDRALERRKGLSEKEDIIRNFDVDTNPTPAASGQDVADRYQNEFENGTEELNTNETQSKNNYVMKWMEMSHAEMKRRLETLTSPSDLGKSVLCFLKKKHLSKAILPIAVKRPQFNPAVNAIHRSTKVFNLEGNIHNTQDAWEIPSTCVYSEIQTERRNSPCCMMPLDRMLIARIKAVFFSHYKEFEEQKKRKNTLELDRKEADFKSDFNQRNTCDEVEDSDDIF